MALCQDPSTRHLQALGYNVVRHPREGIAPLQLLGKSRGQCQVLGDIDKLVTSTTGKRPAIARGRVATDLNGKQSAKLKAALGITLLDGVLQSLGAKSGIRSAYRSARTLQFRFCNVSLDEVKEPLEIGNHLRDSEIDVGNPVLEEYVLGHSDLYVVTSVARSDSLSVVAEFDDGTDIDLDIASIRGCVGTELNVETSSALRNELTYRGPRSLAFAFRCMRVGVSGGDLRLMNAPAGSAALSAGPAIHSGGSAEPLRGVVLATDELLVLEDE
jgi:hypothetical protein